MMSKDLEEELLLEEELSAIPPLRLQYFDGTPVGDAWRDKHPRWYGCLFCIVCCFIALPFVLFAVGIVLDMCGRSIK